MPSAREIEVAAEHFAIQSLGATRTRRARRTKFGDTDFFGADILAYLPSQLHGYHDRMLGLIQAHKHDSNLTRKRKGLERLGGDTPVESVPWARRVVVTWQSTPDPEDGRRKVHSFRVEELVHEAQVKHAPLTVDGRSRRPWERMVWARWEDPVMIPGEWYKASELEVPA